MFLLGFVAGMIVMYVLLEKITSFRTFLNEAVTKIKNVFTSWL